MEIAGEVVAVGGNVRRWKVGDRLCALLSGGGYAQYATAHEGLCLAIPPHLSMVEAAVLPEAIVTVWANVFETAGLSPGETILVHGGASGIGTTAIQMVKLHGAKIFVTAATDEKISACRKLGADLAINYKTEDFVSVVDRETAGRGVDVVLDMVGGDYIVRNLACLAQHGRHVSIATQKGREATIDLRLVMQKQLTLTGSTLRGRNVGQKARLVREVEGKVWPWVTSGAFKPLIYMVYPIKNAAGAHKMMESGAHIGKIALEVAG
jgi:putative PIG3 family NAD(P)H quinone oxidoreductase